MKTAAITFILALTSGCAVIDGLQGGKGSDGGLPSVLANNPVAWSDPEMIPQASADQLTAPRIAVGPDHTVWAAFTEYNVDAGLMRSWISNRTFGDDWATPQILPPPPGFPETSYPQIAIGAAGDPVVAYEADLPPVVDGGQEVRSVWGVRLTNGLNVSQSDVTRLDTSGSNTPQMTQGNAIAVDSSGKAIVVWGEGAGVQANVCASGQTWSGDQTIDGTVGDDGWSADVAAGSNGFAIMGWSSGTNIIAELANVSGGTPSTQPQETLASGTGLQNPLVAARGNKAMAVWEDMGKFNARYYDGSAWRASVVIPDQLGAFGEGALAMNNNGQAVFVWMHYVTGETMQYQGTLYGAFFDGSSWSAPLPIGLQSPTRETWWMDVALDDVGQGLATWADFDSTGTFTRIWASVLRYGSGAPTWDDAQTIDIANPDGGLANDPANVRYCRAALSSDGALAGAVWIQDLTDGGVQSWSNWIK